MVIEASKGGHTNVVHHLLDWPSNILSEGPPPTLTSANLHNTEVYLTHDHLPVIIMDLKFDASIS